MSAREGKIQTEHEGFRGVESGGGLTGGPVPSAVGAMLRATRQRFGWDLEDIERSLRIRLIHLQAIEEGRFEDLPGPAYAVGFVRAYADHLGLDREEVVNQFREEISDLPKRIRLNFPTPIPESRVPSGAIISVAIAIAIIAYGGWYFLSTRHRGNVETVAEVPKQLAEMFKPGLDSGDGTTAPPSEAAAAPTSQPENAPPATTAGPVATAPAATESSAPQPATSVASSTSSAPPVSTTAPAASTAPVAMPPVAQSAPAAPIAAQSTSAHAVSTPAGNAPASSAPASTVPPVSGRSTAESAPANATPTIPESAPQAQPAPSMPEGAAPSDHKTTNEASLSEQFGTLPTSPDQGPAEGQGAQVFGKANTNVRIVIRANADSWVQVRDNDGALILTRMLRAGDSYRVPNKSGLTLLTGNAGALEVYVDGRLAPPLGAVGAIRRDVSLDADRLMAGTAVDN